MITEFGKILRIIRINSGDSAREMGEKLGISTSYLSAIENGKRNIPQGLEATICQQYSLSDRDREKLREAVAASAAQVKIDLTELAEKKRRVIFALTKGDLDDDTVEQLCQVLRVNQSK